MTPDDTDSLESARRYEPPRGSYHGAELRPFDGRPGAMQALRTAEPYGEHQDVPMRSR